MFSTKKFTRIALAAGMLFAASCGSGLMGTPVDKDLSKTEGLSAVKEKVTKAFGPDKKIYSFSIIAKDHMTDEFGMAIADFMENGKDMSQSFFTEPEEKLNTPDPAAVQNEIILKNKQGAVLLKELEFAKINDIVAKAKGMIPKEYEDFHLHTWTYNVSNDKKVTADFTIEGAKKGESSKQQGRMIVSNYYEFPFTMDESGNISMKD